MVSKLLAEVGPVVENTFGYVGSLIPLEPDSAVVPLLVPSKYELRLLRIPRLLVGELVGYSLGPDEAGVFVDLVMDSAVDLDSGDDDDDDTLAAGYVAAGWVREEDTGELASYVGYPPELDVDEWALDGGLTGYVAGDSIGDELDAWAEGELASYVAYPVEEELEVWMTEDD